MRFLQKISILILSILFASACQHEQPIAPRITGDDLISARIERQSTIGGFATDNFVLAINISPELNRLAGTPIFWLGQDHNGRPGRDIDVIEPKYQVAFEGTLHFMLSKNMLAFAFFSPENELVAAQLTAALERKGIRVDSRDKYFFYYF